MRIRVIAAVGVCALAAGIAGAETLSMTGEFAAPHREASLLRSISIDRFSGQDGPALGRAIEQGLSGTHFELLGGRTGRDNAEGSFSGGVVTGVEETPFKKKEMRCVEKDKDGKCVKEQEVEVTCRRRVINVNGDFRLVRNSDGRILYSASRPFRNEVSWCPGQTPPQTVEETVSGAVREMGYSVRGDIAPSRRSYSIRVRESDKGMSKELSKRFKAAIKQTKRDPGGACAGWAAMRAEAPNHPSLLFDLGLCAEWGGDYPAALSLYEQAAHAGAREGNEGIGRVQQLIAGRQDARARANRR